MQKVYEELTSAFRRNNGKLSTKAYSRIVSKNTTLFEDVDTIFLLLQASGYPIEKEGNKFILTTYNRPYQKQEFCVIDIETNGSKPEKAQVIEVGAIRVKNGKIIDTFKSFVECAFVPEYITKITGIKPLDLVDAPSIVSVLNRLRVFMKDSIFVAHNANFDYNFLNHSFERFGLGSIGNQKLCTIDLAKRTISSQKYGLEYLNETLNLGVDGHHRAFNDALMTTKLLNILFDNLPKNIKTTDELLRFSISTKKERAKSTKPNNIK